MTADAPRQAAMILLAALNGDDQGTRVLAGDLGAGEAAAVLAELAGMFAAAITAKPGAGQVRAYLRGVLYEYAQAGPQS